MMLINTSPHAPARTPEAGQAPTSVTTRYGAAPPPRHPVHEPRLVHTLMLLAWLGRLIDPLPHHAPYASRREA